ncbi:MAG: nicotinamidase [Gammaproteobacteria bacterium]
MPESSPLAPSERDALIVVDVQNDFLPGGALGVPEGDAVIEPLNRAIAEFRASDRPVFYSRDWHPAEHCSFEARGGPWPPHCVADTSGAQFAAALDVAADAEVFSKATRPDRDAYSALDGTGLAEWLRAHGVHRLFVGGLATDYCVKATVLDAIAAGFEVILLVDAIRAVNVDPDDGQHAIRAMTAAGARTGRISALGHAGATPA